MPVRCRSATRPSTPCSSSVRSTTCPGPAIAGGCRRAISPFASTIDGLVKGFLAEPAFERIVERNLRDGRHENPERRPRWFTTAYFHLPDEFAEEVRAAGFDLAAMIGIEGPGEWLTDVDDWLDDPPRREALLRAIRRVEAQPSLIGASPHILAVGVKR
jgi:hypothetical protein